MGKREHWLSLEHQLIEEGWYMGREQLNVEVDRLCILSKALG